jgi:hypothetical protein
LNNILGDDGSLELLQLFDEVFLLLSKLLLFIPEIDN